MNSQLQPIVEQRDAFTLVELLVVIGIIALLISILVPTLGKARESANAVKCLSNMRQIGQCVALYTSETKGRFLPPYQIPDETEFILQPDFFMWLPARYLKENPNVMVCPSDNFVMPKMGSQPAQPRTVNYPRMYSGTKDVKYSYAMNDNLPRRMTPVYSLPGYPDSVIVARFNPRPLTPIRHASKVALFLETSAYALLDYEAIQASFRFDHRNRTQMNVVFVDGHCEPMAKKDILPGRPLAPRDQTAWPPGLRIFWFGKESVSAPIYMN